MRLPRLPALALPALLLLTLAACAAHPGLEAGACTPHRIAELPLHSMRNFLLADLAVNGRAATFIVDTGAEASTVTPEAADDLRLPHDPAHFTTLIGIAGHVRTQNVLVRDLGIGTLTRRDSSFGVGTLPSFRDSAPPIAGLLGADILADYDVELDLPHGRMALYAPAACTAHAPLPGATAVPLARTRSGLVFVDAVVDGRAVRARLDTGARVTLIGREAAAAIGLTDASLAHDPEATGRGIGEGRITIHRHRFNEIGVPGAIDRFMSADVADLRLPESDMLLGADYLGPRTTWISYSTGRLFLR